MDKTQVQLLGESAQTLANGCKAVAESGVITEATIASLRRMINSVKADGKGLARKRSKKS